MRSRTSQLTPRERLDRFMRHPVTDAVVMVLIVGSVGLLIADLAIPRTAPAGRLIEFGSHLVTLVFGVELSLRWLAETNKRRFWQRYWIDCLAVLPAFRFFRFLWLLRLLRLFRVGILLSRRLAGYSALFRSGATETVVGLAVVSTLVLAGAVGIQYAEADTMHFSSLNESVWWSVLSLVAGEPVGQTPETTGGRVVALGVMLSGLIVFAIITGVVSANMVDRLRTLDLRHMEIEDLEEQVVICGWNSAGIRIVAELQADRQYSRRGIVVIAEFEKEPSLEGIVPHPALVFFVRGDYTRPEILQKARIDHASRAIILADRTRERSDQDRDARSVLTALLIENINRAHDKDIFTSVELVNRDNAQSLVSAGVEEIVVAYDYVGKIIASSSRHVGMTPIFDELLTAQYGNQFLKLRLPDQSPAMTVDDLRQRLIARAQAILVAVQVDEYGTMAVNPDGGMIVSPGSEFVVIAEQVPDPRVLA